MKTIVIILDVITFLLLFSTLICGLWLRSQPSVDASSIKFHVSLAIPTVLLSATALILTTVAAFRGI